MVDQAEPTQNGPSWQPIETAPKDGRSILICRAGENDSIEITEWCTHQVSTYEEVHGGLYRRVYHKPHEFWNGNGHRATHWMPLPPLPDGG